MGFSDVKTGGFWSGYEALFRPAVFWGQCGLRRVKGLVQRRANIFVLGHCARRVRETHPVCLLLQEEKRGAREEE